MSFETIFPAQSKEIHLNGWTKTKKWFCIRKPDVLQTILACLVDNRKMNVPLTNVLYYYSSSSSDHDIFPLSRVTAGKLETEPKEVCMGKVLRFLVLYDSRVVGLSLRAFHCWCSSRNDNEMQESNTMAIWIWKKDERSNCKATIWNVNVNGIEYCLGAHFQHSAAQSEIKWSGKIKSHESLH